MSDSNGEKMFIHTQQFGEHNKCAMVLLSNKLLPHSLFEMKHLIRHKRASFIRMTTFQKILTVLNTAHPQTCFKYILIMKSSESFVRKQMCVQQTNIWKKDWRQSSICSIAARYAKHNSCSCHNIQAYLITSNKTTNPINHIYFTIK